MHERPNLQGGRVLITGGMGFLGSSLAYRLARDNDVTIIDALTPDAGGNPANLSDCPELTAIDSDLSRASAFEEPAVLSAIRDATHIFHCAARTSHPGSMKGPIKNLESNGEAMLRLLEGMRSEDSQACLILPASTSQTGPMSKAPIDEDHPQRPLDIYSAHKMLQERYLLIYAATYGLNGVSLRLSNVYGPRAAIHTPALGFANYFVGLGLQGRDITVYGDGMQRRSLLYVEDAMDALLAAATTQGVSGQVFQAADPQGTPIIEFARQVTRYIGGSLRSVPYPEERSPSEVGDLVFSVDKIRSVLGWRPTTTIEEGLQATGAYYRSRTQDYQVEA